jgi:hypothetical protein
VEPRRDAIDSHHVTVHHRDVILAVPVVPERDDPEPTEPGRQVGDRLHLHADAGRAEAAAAVVVLVPLDQLLERGDRRMPVHGG